MTSEETGRAVLRIYLHGREFPASGATSYVGAAVKTGRCMDFAERIRRQADELTSAQLVEYARLVGLDLSDLTLWVLPAMKRAGVLDYITEDGQVTDVQEYIGVQAPFLKQTEAVWRALGPSPEELCALESVGLAASAPMAMSEHQHLLSTIGYPEEAQGRVLAALEALHLLQRAHSEPLGEDVMYSEYVWGDLAVPIAEFLKTLPGAERQVLTELSSKALNRPGTALNEFGLDNTKLVQAAQQVGFLDPVAVQPTGRSARSFAFHPALERQLATKNASDALHQRKLLVAHVLFGHRFGFPGTGRIDTPVKLMEALISKGTVGPATAIKQDWSLIEAAGIARVRPYNLDRGRAYLDLIKQDVAHDSMELLRAALGESEPRRAGGGEDPLAGLWVPGTYFRPEQLRMRGQLKPGPEKEVFDSSIAELRKQARRRTRLEDVL